MRRPLPPLNWLRAFEASARHLSFTGAARELNMTQSAVSQHIKSLEQHLKQPLFLRRSRTLELTRTGATYLPVVRDAFATLSRGTTALMMDQRSAVQVHTNLSFAAFWLAPRLKKFYALHPNVRLNIVTELWEPLEYAASADLEVRFSLRPADDARAERLASEYFYPVAAPDWKGNLETIAQTHLFDCANMLCNWQAWIEDQDIPWPNLPITYASTYAVSLNAAMAGGGLAMGHHSLTGRLIAEGKLVRPFEHQTPMQEAYYLICAPHMSDIPGAPQFANWLRSQMKRDHKNSSQLKGMTNS